MRHENIITRTFARVAKVEILICIRAMLLTRYMQYCAGHFREWCTLLLTVPAFNTHIWYSAVNFFFIIYTTHYYDSITVLIYYVPVRYLYYIIMIPMVQYHTHSAHNNIGWLCVMNTMWKKKITFSFLYTFITCVCFIWTDKKKIIDQKQSTGQATTLKSIQQPRG
jgi:hypothetical protein